MRGCVLVMPERLAWQAYLAAKPANDAGSDKSPPRSPHKTVLLGKEWVPWRPKRSGRHACFMPLAATSPVVCHTPLWRAAGAEDHHRPKGVRVDGLLQAAE
jgi:hypothetical protein